MEAYVDDIVVKSIQPLEHVKDLEEKLGSLESMIWNLIPKSVFFRVTSRKCLGYLYSWDRSKLDKIQALVKHEAT